jgi:acylglycerol lipase
MGTIAAGTADQTTASSIAEALEGGSGKLFVRGWRPSSPVRAVVAICPGFNAHSGMYGWVGEQFAAHGIASYAVDLRGRGKSEGERFYTVSFEDYVEDLSQLVQFAKEREPGLPVFLLGHSAGAVVAVLYALDGQGGLSGFICEDIAFELPAPDFALAVLKGVSHVAPHAHALTLHNADFSRDPAVVEAMDQDPLIAGESQPFATMAALVHADERLKADMPKIALPVLIIHGTADKAAKLSGSQHIYDRISSGDKTLKLYDGRYHDPLHDLGKEEVMVDIQAWVDARVGG